MKPSTVIVRSRGIAEVPSHIVTPEDAAKADAAAQWRASWPGLTVTESRRLYYEIDASRIADPVGLAARRIEAIWEFALHDDGSLLSELLQ